MSAPATRGESHHVAGAPLSPTLITSHCYIQASHCGLFLIHEKFFSLFSGELTRQLKSRGSVAQAVKGRKCDSFSMDLQAGLDLS